MLKKACMYVDTWRRIAIAPLLNKSSNANETLKNSNNTQKKKKEKSK